MGYSIIFVSIVSAWSASWRWRVPCWGAGTLSIRRDPLRRRRFVATLRLFLLPDFVSWRYSRRSTSWTRDSSVAAGPERPPGLPLRPLQPRSGQPRAGAFGDSARSAGIPCTPRACGPAALGASGPDPASCLWGRSGVPPRARAAKSRRSCAHENSGIKT